MPDPEDSDGPEEAYVAALLKADLFNREEKITNFLTENGRERYPSGIVNVIDLPKSTVSPTLKSLHE